MSTTAILKALIKQRGRHCRELPGGPGWWRDRVVQRRQEARDQLNRTLGGTGLIDAPPTLIDFIDEHVVFRIHRWLYVMKAIICVLLGRHDETLHYADDRRSINGLVYWDFHHYCPPEDVPSTSWMELSVGRGLFKNWYYDECDNATA